MNLSLYDTSTIAYPEDFQKVFQNHFDDPTNKFKHCSPYSIKLYAPYNRKGKYDVGYRNLASLDSYQDHFKTLFRVADDSTYTNTMTYLWLREKFSYKGSDYSSRAWKNSEFVKSYSLFVRGYVGGEQKVYFGNTLITSTLELFIDKLYGGKEFYRKSDPIETPPVQPFRNLYIGHYIAVREMDEALNLLKYADDKKMSLNSFLDFLVNYVASYNAKYGDKYLFLARKSGMQGAVLRLEGGTRFSRDWLGQKRNIDRIKALNEKYGRKHSRTTKTGQANGV